MKPTMNTAGQISTRPNKRKSIQLSTTYKKRSCSGVECRGGKNRHKNRLTFTPVSVNTAGLTMTTEADTRRKWGAIPSNIRLVAAHSLKSGQRRSFAVWSHIHVKNNTICRRDPGTTRHTARRKMAIIRKRKHRFTYQRIEKSNLQHASYSRSRPLTTRRSPLYGSGCPQRWLVFVTYPNRQHRTRQYPSQALLRRAPISPRAPSFGGTRQTRTSGHASGFCRRDTCRS